MNPFAPKRILCAVDLGAASPRVLAWAALFGRTFGAEVSVLYVDWWEPPQYFTEGQIQSIAAEAAKHRQATHAKLQRLARAALGRTFSHTVRVIEGQPAGAILSRAQEIQAELIVMGSHGRTGLARLRLGSVAEDVVRSASCPLLIVKDQNDTGPRLRELLCPVKPGDSIEELIAWSASLAAAFQSTLLLVSVAEDRNSDLNALRTQLCGRVPAAARERCNLAEVVRAGNAAEEIVLAAREKDADLIVLPAEHRPFLELTTLGTTTERVMRHSSCSVLVTPREHRPAAG